MFEDYTTEQLRKLYYHLPEELQEASTSPETTAFIETACKRHKLSPEKTDKVIELTGYVFLGLLPPEELPEALVKELKLKKTTANKVYQEIYRSVFFPLKYQLYQLYHRAGGPLETPKGLAEKTEAKEEPEKKISEEKKGALEKETTGFEKIEEQEQKPEKTEKLKFDPYREPIE